MDDSPFGRLAPELRNQIYELVFEQQQHIHARIHCKEVADVSEQNATLPDSSNLTAALQAYRMMNGSQEVAKEQPSGKKRWTFVLVEQSRPAITDTCRKIREETSQYDLNERARVSYIIHTFGFDQTEAASLKSESPDASPESAFIECQDAILVIFHKYIFGIADRANYPRSIEIDFGTWVVQTCEVDCSTRLRWLRGPIGGLVKMLAKSGIQVQYRIKFNYTSVPEALQMQQTICLSANNQQTSHLTAQASVSDKSKEVYDLWKGGKLAGYAFSIMQGDLNKCRKFLEEFVNTMTFKPPTTRSINRSVPRSWHSLLANNQP